jgi:DNA-binding transcriptional MerR regulator
MPKSMAKLKTKAGQKRPSFTVKQVASLSGVSVRTLHFYDESGLLKPAFHGANGYRYYVEPQLLTLQQILFYRELGFELKRIKKILGRRDFEKIDALQSHRKVLQQNLARTGRLIDTIDKTIAHLKGTKPMKSEEIFAGFTVAAGDARFGEQIKLGAEFVDCKVSSKDTNGAMCVFEVTSGWPKHLHHDQDEWLYIIEGQVEFEIAKKRFRAAAGESIFIPRKTPHVWSQIGAAKILTVYQPAGKMEQCYSAISAAQKNLPTAEDVANQTYTKAHVDLLHKLFADYDMDLLGPPLIPEELRA